MTTSICIVGTIATDPKLSRTSTQVAFCTFRVASNERRYDREQGQWIDGETNWFTVNSFRGLAEHASESFAKGDRVVVSGRVRMRRWESGEKSGTAVEVEAEAFGHDLRWGVSSFTKRSGAAAGAERGAVVGDTGSAAGSTLTDSTAAEGSGGQSGWHTVPGADPGSADDTDDDRDGFAQVAA